MLQHCRILKALLSSDNFTSFKSCNVNDGNATIASKKPINCIVEGGRSVMGANSWPALADPTLCWSRNRIFATSKNVGGSEKHVEGSEKHVGKGSPERWESLVCFPDAMYYVEKASPHRLYRAALLRNRFLDTILKAREKAVEKVR
uniref:Global transcription factor n=1 Tax=Cucumis melo subsp. melo TaxID=412675 RepID=E5GBN5_CUCME|nr:global transcription factor [Cucumis melo subsp. melo]